MNVSTSVSATVHSGRVRLVGLIAVAAAVIAVGAWALTTYVVDAGSQRVRASVAAQPTVLASLSPQDRQYVEAITALTPRQIAAAFGTVGESGNSVLASLSPHDRQFVEAITALSTRQIAAAFGTADASATNVLASLSPQNRQYVEAIMALTPAQIAAAFGTDWAKSWGVLQSLSPANRQYVEAITALTPQQIAAAFGTAGESANSIVLTPQQIESIGAAFGTGR